MRSFMPAANVPQAVSCACCQRRRFVLRRGARGVVRAAELHVDRADDLLTRQRAVEQEAAEASTSAVTSSLLRVVMRSSGGAAVAAEWNRICRGLFRHVLAAEPL